MEILLGNKNFFWPIKGNNGHFSFSYLEEYISQFLIEKKHISNLLKYFWKEFSTLMDRISQSDFLKSLSDRRSFQKANSKIDVWEGSLEDHFWVAWVKNALELFKMF